jgi:uncharacterized membrane protein YphA (DoxX/SURF4 family)
MKILTIIARLLLGLAFVAFGSNFFLHFIPMGSPPTGLAGDFYRVMSESGYLYVIGAMQFIGGLLVLIGVFVPLGLTILAAMLFNILTFHLVFAPAGIGPGIVLSILEFYLIWAYRERFAPLLRP